MAASTPVARSLLGACVVSALALGPPPAAAQAADASPLRSGPVRSCESLQAVSLPATTIATTAVVSAGSFSPPAEKPIAGLPAFCRVAGVIAPSPDSHIEFELWLPAAGWNGKLQGMGNGGFAGSIAYDGLGRAVRAGYAAVASDTGHKGSGIDASWALGHPEKVVDFGHRAVHEMTVKAKALAEAFYGKAPRRAYFSSCSNGGRQALMEASRYPADYDGVIAGAPAAAWTSFMTDFAWNAQALAAPGAHIPPAKVPEIEKAVLAECDARGGVKDGVVDDPRNCGFDPRSILCKDDDAPGCLTAPQAEALAKIYAGPHTRDGRRLAPGFPPGGESGAGGWAAWITGPAPGGSVQAMFATQFGANMAFERPEWDFRAFDFDRDPPLVARKMGPVLDASDPDLSAFRARGGKLILYHGWSDPALAAGATVEYFESVRRRMGEAVTDSFARLYLMPGTQHCGGGPGASFCGELTVPAGDATHDFSAALERWVEEGVAPGRMIGVKPAADGRGAPLLTRPLCPYPREAVYGGMGDANDPGSWSCAAR